MRTREESLKQIQRGAGKLGGIDEQKVFVLAEIMWVLHDIRDILKDSSLLKS